MSVEPFEAIVLAAGRGVRMKSRLPKVLHRAAGQPLLLYPVRAALGAGARRVVVVVGRESASELQAALQEAFGDAVTTVTQDPPRGTGDAARVGLGGVSSEVERVVVLCGDAPLVTSEDVTRLLEPLHRVELTLLSCELDEPRGYGRVLRDTGGRVLSIREERDLEDERQRAVREVNAGAYAVRRAFLSEAVLRLDDRNAQGELYLTDVVAQAAARAGVEAVRAAPEAVRGVNDRQQLAEVEELLHQRVARRLRLAGATVRAGARIDEGVEVAADAVIETGAVLRGATRVGEGAVVDVGAVLTDAVVEAGARVLPHAVLTGSRVEAGAQVGPLCHLRPGSEIGPGAHVGNFVETKQTRLGRGAKANHLAYLGDGEVGEGANIGAGTIFCNYDGFQKHRTEVGAGAFIGSDSQLVAPVRVGAGAYVATGTTVTRDVPDGALAIGRTPQQNKEGYAARLRGRLEARSRRR